MAHLASVNAALPRPGVATHRTTAQSANFSQEERPKSRYWANLGSFLADPETGDLILDEDGQKVFVSLGGFALDGLKLPNGNGAISSHRREELGFLLETATGLQPGQNALFGTFVVEIRHREEDKEIAADVTAKVASRHQRL